MINMAERRVLIFKTTVTRHREVKQLRPVLNRLIPPGDKWNFDLEDCDRILRVETQNMPVHKVEEALLLNGYFCTELED